MKTIPIIVFVLTTLQSYGQYQWTILGENEKIKPDAKYHLFNLESRKVLAYQKQKKGINLGWFEPQKTKLNILFKDTNADGILDERDSVAIHVEDGAYLKYGEREYSITIVWSQTPVYEWIIMAEKLDVRTGTHTQTRYALFNRTKQAFMIYAERDGIGVRLQWSDDW